MSIEAIRAVLLVLLIVFILSRIWFHFVEWLLNFIKRIFSKKTNKPAWHPLSEEQEED